MENPHRLGKRLLYPPYAGIWSARRGMYRVLDEIDDENRVVLATAVEHRADAYRALSGEAPGGGPDPARARAAAGRRGAVATGRCTGARRR
ncbi:type II toxin-antitoxin system RelE/ParE family toxin [Frankia sp. AiPa1]|uniref:type II toxin-antitoxin system RelE family toxin n=1 Tax=Frankia sp. AiPa1 TaxID=573492 RepID=UPI00202B0584|nr:type II toxin-antitoxin system RelE/ParE family toxin [Frankia sp. AiPa1]MCL9758975.1 type II toxin-antitoxin system RelE/ParE family toxin [Frankia sp. AiPa1]